ncbi:signal transduction histidine kinase [Cellulosimicrobium cellulans]|uniref:sensor histidine kinase n=1 Tax=Cellulosimicrobium cellulans TaxID=1710 RepID=UPI00195C8088|nr:histidine kinase [Cellulosimicrobium cellulans]MBM7820476.1 signal transduction histidine kinase [Cellulosimicrobium cellulans]
MRRTDPEVWAGIAMLVVILGIGALVPIAAAEAVTLPVGAWLGVFAAFVLVTVGIVLRAGFGTPRAYTLLGAQVVLVATLVLTAPGAGWLPILLVVVAALSVYVVPVPAVAVVVAVNVVVAGAAVGLRGSATDAVLTAMIYLLLQVASVGSTLALQRERRMREQLAVAHVELRAAAVLRDESTRSDERLRIARELHDVLGHQLTVLALELETASHQDGGQAREHVLRAKGVARELLGDVRATVGELRRQAPSLEDSLGSLVERVSVPRVRVAVADDVMVDEDQTVVLVRVVQEALTNAIRHAEATVLDVTVTTEEGRVRLVAQDDGWGAARVVPGNGLRGIEERVRAAGGTVRLDGRNGFRVEVELAPERRAALAENRDAEARAVPRGTGPVGTTVAGA